MAFCPRCGAPTTPGMRFCASCGERLAAGVMPPAPPASAAPPFAATPAAAHAPGPAGRPREGMIVVLLAIITFGLYGLYFWWVTSRELDDYTRKPGNSHNLIRIGTIISVVAGVVLFFAGIAFVASIIAEAASGGEPSEEEILAMVFGGIGLFFLVGTAGFVGSVIRLVGKWRMWSALEEDERRRLHASPLSAGLMLALTILSWFVPFVGWVLPLVVLYMTAEHLNEAWQAAGAPTSPSI
ncbi:MAG TPA: DUF4234 domain-containing protein [Candidatus Thermoplasmatota archaeon]|nr:DUF4234 domain-containing protein [Candidatus Thermoplasmatota archaeon]